MMNGEVDHDPQMQALEVRDKESQKMHEKSLCYVLNKKYVMC